MIPRTLHVIWVGDESRRPDNCIETWRQHNPDWELRIWGNEELASYGWVNARHMRQMAQRELAGVADLMRLEILYNEGGFYIDADSICVRPLEPWLFEGEACACWENELVRPGLISNGYLASVPDNPFFGQMILDLQALPELDERMAWESVGPQFLTDSVRKQGYNGLTIWPSHFFIPKHFTGLEYSGGGQVFATQEWGSTLRGYADLHKKRLPGVASFQELAPAAQANAALTGLLQQAQALLDGKQWAAAADLLQQALAQAPADGGLWLTLARTLRAAHQPQAWLDAAEQAIRHAATEAHGREALLLAAQAAMALNDHDYVVRLVTALPEAQRRQEFELLRLQGTALNRLHRPRQAVEVLMQALSLKLDDRDAYVELGFAFDNLKMKAEAAECFRTVATLHPEHLGAQAYLLHLEQHTAQWGDYRARIQALLDAQTQAAQTGDATQFSVPFTLVSLPHHPRQMLEAATLTSRYLSQGLVPLPPAPARPPRATRRLHVGLLSNDLQAHATATLITEVIERLDRSRYEISFFSHAADDGSDYRRRLSAACDHFEDVQGLGLLATAQRIRELGVDLLIDLKGHTSGSRLAVLAYRPAPLQATWLGFPGTTGLDGVDYVIGDRFVTPLDHQPWYSERIAQLPHSYQPNDGHRPRGPAPSRAELGLPQDAVVLLSANQVYKLNPPLFDAWMEILRRVPQAVLWQLSGSDDGANAALQREAAARGVAPERLVFMPAAGLQEHALRLGAADLALDSWPCNGHTTTSDTLWAGVPVVSLLGESFAGRVSASLLDAVGLPELVCADVPGYVELACRLASEPQTRAALRERLLQARDQAPLFDANGFASDLEALWERLWARHEAGEAPRTLEARLR
ncbi:MAG: hypothetical protein DI603_03865 [Roseateles depolymerans]|uniref:protein O-GlcNAc transferase n=1 Tax=Roseateles depolymerans TaxID=76731 RepID=A0A2W5E0L5_9BURK|nr:MAG: hypothetical protein DI603_03865 [Roseateles depolymerans]